MRRLSRRRALGLLGSLAVLAGARIARAADPPRVGALLPYFEGDPLLDRRLAALFEGAASTGWDEGEDFLLVRRLCGNDAALAAAMAAELVAMDVDVLFSASTPSSRALYATPGDTPIVFASISDPLGAGFVKSIAHPGGRGTGSMLYEASLGGKWVELLGRLVPGMRTIGVLYNPDTVVNPGAYWFGTMRDAAAAQSVQLRELRFHGEDEIASLIQSIAPLESSGLFVAPDLSTQTFRSTIVAAVAALRLPTLYAGDFFVHDGGLVSYGASYEEAWRLAGTYIGRILSGAVPGDLPVQAPDKFELFINLATARAQGIVIPPDLLATATAVIE